MNPDQLEDSDSQPLLIHNNGVENINTPEKTEEYTLHLAAIVESSDDAIISQLLDGTIKTWNKGSEKMFGYGAGEAVGKDISLIIPPEYSDEEKKNLQRICNNEIVNHSETVLFKKGGGEIYVSLTVLPWTDSAGNIIGASKIARDITSRIKLEEELKMNIDELKLQNEEKDKRAAELIIANRELEFQHEEKEKRAAELIIANQELVVQNNEKEKRATELVIANKELIFQNEEKEKLAHELKKEVRQTEFEKMDKEALINCTDDLMWTVSSDFKLIASNKAFIQSLEAMSHITLKPGDDLLMKDIFDADSLAFWKKAYRKALSGNSFKEEIYTPSFNNWEESWADISFNPVYKDDAVVAIACYSRNITERKLADEKIRQSEASLSIAQAMAHVGSWETNLLNFEVSWSEETCRIFGVSRGSSKISHQNFLGFVHPDDRGKVDAAFMVSVSNNSVNTIEHRIILSDGHVKDVEERWHIVTDNTGRPSRAVGTIQDITERKLSEEKIRDSELRYRSLIEQATDAIVFTDDSFRFIDANVAACQMLGYSKQEFLKLYLYDFLFKEDLLVNALQLDELKLGKPIRNERKLKRKDGSILEMEVSGTLLGDGSYMIFGQDITERKQAARLISESEAKYRAFFENSIDGILLTVADGAILSANPAACKMFQMTEKEICTAGRNGLIDLKDPRAEALIKERQLTGIAKGELMYMRKDGSKFPGEISSVLFKDAYGQERTSMIIRDISERKKTEEKLVAAANDLQHAVNDLNKIMDSSLDVICAVDANGNFIKVSAASEAVWGYRPEELIGKPLINLVHHEDNEETYKTADHVMAGNNVNHFENRYIHKDGSLVPIEWSARWDEKDQIRYGIARDVTAKKRLEKELKGEQRRLKNLFSQAPTSMGVLRGANHVFEVANPLYLTLIGKKNIIGKTVEEILPEVIEQGFIKILNHVYETGDTFTANEMLVKINQPGNEEPVDKYLNFIYQAYRNIENQIEGIFFFIIDVTEQVLSRRKIEKSERRLKEAQAISHVGNWEINLKSNVHYWSEEVYNLFGITKGDVAPSEDAFMSFCHPEDLQDTYEIIENGFKTFENISFYFRFIRADGDIRYSYNQWKYKFNEDGNAERLSGIFQDVTERKLAEEALKQSEARLREFFDNAPESIVVVDLESSKFSKTNLYASKLFKFSAEEFSRKGPADISPEFQPDGRNSAEKSMEYIKKAMAGERVVFEWVHCDADRKEIMCEVHLAILPDTSRPQIYGSIVDITERKRAEEKIRNSEQRYRTLFEQNLAGFYQSTPNGKLITCNVAFANMLKYDSPEQLLKVNTRELYFSDEERNTFLRNVLEKKKLSNHEGVLKCKDGSPLYFLENISEQKDPVTGMEFFDGILIDVTEKRIAESKLKEINERFINSLEEKNTILESIGDAFFAVDENWTVTYWNKEAEKMLVRSKKEIVDHNFWDAFPEWRNSELYQKFHQAVGTRQAVDFEVNYAPLDKWYEAIAYPSTGGLSVYFKDVTQRKHSEIQLHTLNRNLQKQARELTQSNEELEQFAYIASHDLQEPLRMVSSFLTLLEKKYGDKIDDKGKEYIDFAVDGAKRMRQIILDLLEFSRAGRINDKKEDVDVNKVIEGLKILLRKQVEDKGAVFISDKLPVIISHETPVRQIFQNLISNALKYSRKDVSCEIQISATKLNTRWQFAVRDNGIGIAEEYFDKIFLIFQRLHAKEEFSGTGMGLAVTKKLIENLGGKIWVESEEGKGSTFYFTLSKT